MTPLPGQRVWVVGRDPSGEAADALLRAGGALPVLLDARSEPAYPGPDGPDPDFMVLSAGCLATPPFVQTRVARGVPLLAERELAFEHSFCLHVAITGACGKSTTAQLVVHLLRATGRRVALADPVASPACSLVPGSRELDFMVHAVEPRELEHCLFFRPVVGVLLNALPEGADGPVADARLLARLFARQQAFDWAVVQLETLARLDAAGVRPPGKVVTFSGTDRGADLGVDRGLLQSRWEGWTGPLWDMDRGHLRGVHLAENLLAALAVARVLRVALEEVTPALATFATGPGRMEDLGEADGIRFVDDGRARNLLALEKGLKALAPTPPPQPFVVLVAGGDAVSGSAYELGPVLAPRVRQVRLFGPAGSALQAAWNLFTPCSIENSRLNALRRATDEATAGEVVLYSPACPHRERPPGPILGDDSFREIVRQRRAARAPDSAPHPVAGRPVAGPND